MQPQDNPEFVLRNFISRDEQGTVFDNEKVQEIKFYEKGADGEVIQEGTIVEEVISLAIARLWYLYDKFPSLETEMAVSSLQQARSWLEIRTRDRINRGVEGKHQK